MSSNVTDFGPDDLLSSPREGTRRAKVEHDQTAFFEGRIFRTFKEWQVATTTVYAVKVVTPINLVLSTLGIQLDQGSARLESLIQVTEGGSFSEVCSQLHDHCSSSSAYFANQLDCRGYCHWRDATRSSQDQNWKQFELRHFCRRGFQLQNRHCPRNLLSEAHFDRCYRSTSDHLGRIPLIGM